MIDSITNWINALVGWVDALPLTFLAILAGVAIGGLSTQWLKRTFPFTVMFGVTKETAVMLLRITAFVFSALPTYFIWPCACPDALWAALFAGFIAPMVYKAASYFLYRSFPKMEARMSGTTGVADD